MYRLQGRIVDLTRDSAVHTESTNDAMERMVALAKALSDPIRVRMVRLLADGRARCGFPTLKAMNVPGSEETDGICVCEFQEVFNLGQSKVSYHLRILREAGLVLEESRGKWSFYSLNRRALREMATLMHDEFHL